MPIKKKTTKRGYLNRNDQMVLRKGHRSDNHRFANGYRLQCQNCSHEYWANGCDIYQRKCPECQGGEK
jgi:hypothetical protein